MFQRIQAIILAAGKSTRFNTSATKLSHTLCGQEMILFPLKLLRALSIKTTVVVGYQKEVLAEIFNKHNLAISTIEQTVQKGTGHAVLCTQAMWDGDHILIMNGDAPLIKREHIEDLINKHITANATISFVGAYNADPSVKGYGRIITDDSGAISIIEQKEFTGDPEKECRFNVGLYLINRQFLEKTLPHLHPHAHGELYITDLIKKASDEKLRIEVLDIPFDYARGINTLKELWIAEHILKSDIISSWMDQGVRFAAPQTTHIDLGVSLSADTSIGYGVQLRNNTQIASGVIVDAYSILDNARIETNARILSHSIISNATVAESSQIGPFAHIHRNSSIGKESVIGNFVEVSKSTVGQKSKAKHLAYLGQAHLGREVNIGAGTITCNYNGVSKHETIINDNAFIGSNTALIAPVTVGEHALVAAGSVITENVPSHALAIARQKQVNKENYAIAVQTKYKKLESL